MPPTTYPHINQMLDHLLNHMRQILGAKLVGLYLYGSLVSGDYDDDISDVDLLAAISSDLDETEFNALKTMHEDVVRNNRRWDNRLEIAYLSLDGLKTFKTRRSSIAIISPGEPFHIKDAGKDWLLNWYFVREKGVVVFGPPPKAIIEPIAKEEFLQTVKQHAQGWRDWVNNTRGSRPYQSYAILTLCRALYTCKNGEQVSKRQAALWAEKELPEWAALINNALIWRKAREKDVDPEATFPETQRFVYFVIDRIFS